MNRQDIVNAIAAHEAEYGVRPERFLLHPKDAEQVFGDVGVIQIDGVSFGTDPFVPRGQVPTLNKLTHPPILHWPPCARCQQEKDTAEGRAVKAVIVFHTCFEKSALRRIIKSDTDFDDVPTEPVPETYKR